MKESDIQRAILDWLLWHKVLAWRSQAIPVPIRRGRAIIGLRKADPNTVGIPDIFAVRFGRLVGIEVKSAVGRQSPAQKDWQRRLEEAGSVYLLVRSLEDVERVWASL